MDRCALFVVPRIVEYIPRLGSRCTVWSGRLSASGDLSICVDTTKFMCMLPVIEEETTLSYVAVACGYFLYGC